MLQPPFAFHVNIPFAMLYDAYLPLFLKHRFNPEIGFDAACFERFEFQDFAEIALKLADAGLSVTLHAPFMDLSPGSPDGLIREAAAHRFRQLLALAPLFKPRTIVGHTGYENDRYWFLHDDWLARSLEHWTWVAGELAGTQTRLMLENVHEKSPDDFAGLFAAFDPDRVGFCLDIGHQSAYGKAPLEQWLTTLGPYLGQLHLHDNRGDGDTHLGLGQGAIDLDPLCHFLADASHPRPVITLEPHTETDLWHSLDYLSLHPVLAGRIQR